MNTVDKHSVCYAVENHPNDSRIKVDDEGIVQTLSSRMGTGGGNTPIVLIALDAFKTQEEDGGTNAKRSLR